MHIFLTIGLSELNYYFIIHSEKAFHKYLLVRAEYIWVEEWKIIWQAMGPLSEITGRTRKTQFILQFQVLCYWGKKCDCARVLHFDYWLGYKIFANNKVIFKIITICCMFLHLKNSHCFMSWPDIASSLSLWLWSILIYYWFLKGHKGLHLLITQLLQT